MAKTNAKTRPGDIVAVRFLDHVQDGDEPIEFIVFGRVHAVKRTHLVIASWVYADPTIPTDANELVWTIVKSAVTQIQHLTPQ